MKPRLIIGTRPSKLALWQAEHVKELLEEKFPITVTLKKITTKGDKILDRSLVEVGGKGLFLKEIEDALCAHQIDLAVHSLKDVPFDLPEGLVLGAILSREDARDAWISRDGKFIADARAGAVVGTTSLRRSVQLKKLYPELTFRDLRGNVDTRLAKLQKGEFDGIVLALAGLKRLGLDGHMTQTLDDIVPAVGQGAVTVECRADDANMLFLLKSLHDEATARAVNLERVFLRAANGSCQTPLGCHVTASADDSKKFSMRCFLAEPDGSRFFAKTVMGGWEEGEIIVTQILQKWDLVL